jgi:hypothetical protein
LTGQLQHARTLYRGDGGLYSCLFCRARGRCRSIGGDARRVWIRMEASSTSTPSIAEMLAPSVPARVHLSGRCPAPPAPSWLSTGSTAATASLMNVDGPFSVAGTQVHTLRASDGAVIVDTSTVSVC